jgi:shikimate dehydrogenase
VAVPGRPVSGSTRLGAVIGCPVHHSRSPSLFNAAYAALGLDRVFVAFEVAPGAAGGALVAMRTLGIDHLSVTMPHKTDVANAVDELTDEARLLDAVNCVVNHDGTLIGHNTDGPGLLAALAHESGFDPAGRSCAVVGAGGAARAVVLALARAGASEVVVVNRTRANAESAALLAGPSGRVGSASDLGGVDLVVDATPSGMAGQPDLSFDPSVLTHGQLVADLVYHPAQTPLVAAARAQGITAVNGLGMLVHQAAVQFELVTGVPAPLKAMWAAASTS